MAIAKKTATKQGISLCLNLVNAALDDKNWSLLSASNIASFFSLSVLTISKKETDSIMLTQIRDTILRIMDSVNSLSKESQQAVSIYLVTYNSIVVSACTEDVDYKISMSDSSEDVGTITVDGSVVEEATEFTEDRELVTA